MKQLVKKPSAWIPLLLSLGVLGMLLITLFTSGVQYQKDEGVEAHIFQIWLVLEVILIGFFGVKWLPRMPQDTALIMALQILLVLLTCFPVFYFHL